MPTQNAGERKAFFPMKKLLLITLILSLLCVPALAEENTVPAAQMNWDNATISAFVAAGYDGNHATVTLQDGKQFKILIPEGFEQRDVTEEESTRGVVLAFANADGAEFCVLDVQFENAETLSEVASILEGNVSTLQHLVLNGTDALLAGVEAQDCINIYIELGGHRFVQIDFTPVTGSNALIPFFIAAIQF